MLSDSFRHHLRAILFGSTDSPGSISSNQYESPMDGFYQGKPAPFISNWDLLWFSGRAVSYQTVGMQNFLLPGEMDELNAHFTSNYAWELRIVKQNQWSREGIGQGYPGWHMQGGSGVKRITPYDLNDVASMLGYRGSAQDTYRQAWPTGIISSQSITSGVYAYYLNHSLVGQTSHHPRGSAHHPATSNWGGNFAGWGRPAIVNLGDTRVKRYGGSSPLNVNELICHATGTIPHPTLFFGDGRYRINSLYQSITGGDYNIIHPGYFHQITGYAPAWNNHFYTYEYKRTLTKNDILNGVTGYFNFPIGRHAIHELLRRDYTVNNDRIPDCFNYTVAVVIYKYSGNHNWYVEDIIYDRLRTIDRWDIAKLRQDQHAGLDYKHPTMIIQGSNSYGWVRNGDFYSCTFSGIPQEWMERHFNFSGTTIELGNHNTDDWVKGRMFLITSVEDFTGEVVQDRIYKLCLHNYYWGQEPTQDEGWTTDSQMDVTSSYEPSSQNLYVHVYAYGSKNPNTTPRPLLVWYK